MQGKGQVEGSGRTLDPCWCQLLGGPRGLWPGPTWMGVPRAPAVQHGCGPEGRRWAWLHPCLPRDGRREASDSDTVTARGQSEAEQDRSSLGTAREAVISKGSQAAHFLLALPWVTLWARSRQSPRAHPRDEGGGFLWSQTGTGTEPSPCPQELTWRRVSCPL